MKFKLLTPSENLKPNHNYINPYDKKANKHTVKHFTEGLTLPLKHITSNIDWYSNNTINYLSKKYELPKSEVIRILLLDSCYDIRSLNKTFPTIYNMWHLLAIQYNEKENIFEGGFNENN